MTQKELEIAQAACCVGTIWDQYEGTEKFNEMVGKRVQHLIKLIRKHLEQEQPMPDSTKLIELWHEDKEMLKEKDFRDDPWMLAYNAFMCGFGRGIAVKKQEQPANMIQWTGSNLQEVIDFTGKSPKIGEWFKSWDEFESYVHSHGDILKLFAEDGSHFEVPVGAWIVKTPDGYNVPSVARFIHAKQEQPEVPNGKFVFPKYLYARTKDNKTIDMSYAPQDMTAVEYVRNDFIKQEQQEVDLEKDVLKDARWIEIYDDTTWEMVDNFVHQNMDGAYRVIIVKR